MRRVRIQKWIEVLAVLCSLLYTFLYLHSSSWCFVFGLLSPLLFIFITLKKKIYADTTLQVFYVLITFYGIIHWGGEWPKEHWSAATHLVFVISGFALATLSGFWLRRNTDAALPFIDSFTTVYAVIATWMMMNFVHENWIYFMVINSTSMFIYFNRKLYWGVAMFFIYLLMSVDGYFELNLFQLW
ncbi:MAG: nicotinamide riboside transporter PnuC [Flavobacteriales bacterium]